MVDNNDSDVNNVAACAGYIRLYLSFYDDLTKKKRGLDPETAVNVVQGFMLNYLAHTQHCVPEQSDEPQIFFMPQQEGEG